VVAGLVVVAVGFVGVVDPADTKSVAGVETEPVAHLAESETVEVIVPVNLLEVAVEADTIVDLFVAAVCLVVGTAVEIGDLALGQPVGSRLVAVFAGW
jgi:hypothetical protein